MRARYIWDRTAGELVSAEEYAKRQAQRVGEKRHAIGAVKRLRRGPYLWRAGKWGHVADMVRRMERGAGLQVIRDLEPYRAAGADVACDGKRPVVGGRRQHREFLRRNGYVEVGNTPLPPRRQQQMPAVREDLQRAMATGMPPEIRAAAEAAKNAGKH